MGAGGAFGASIRRQAAGATRLPEGVPGSCRCETCFWTPPIGTYRGRFACLHGARIVRARARSLQPCPSRTARGQKRRGFGQNIARQEPKIEDWRQGRDPHSPRAPADHAPTQWEWSQEGTVTVHSEPSPGMGEEPLGLAHARWSALAWNPRSDGPEQLRPCSVEGRQLASQPGKNSRGLFFLSGSQIKPARRHFFAASHPPRLHQRNLRPRVLLRQP